MTNQRYINHITQRAKALVQDAESMGLVLTIEQRPLQPLAMGNTETVVSVRPARERAAPPFDLDKMCRDALDRLRRQNEDAALHASYLLSVNKPLRSYPLSVNKPLHSNYIYFNAP